jgi:hypothetical protein
LKGKKLWKKPQRGGGEKFGDTTVLWTEKQLRLYSRNGCIGRDKCNPFFLSFSADINYDDVTQFPFF